MKNNTYLIVVGISILLAFIGALFFNFSSNQEMVENGRSMYFYGLRIGGMTGLILMLTNGTFIGTKNFKVAQAGVAIVVVGINLKILHWTAFAS